MDYLSGSPAPLRDFLVYMETIAGKSKKTIDEYFLDLRQFLRYIKQKKNNSLASTALNEIQIEDIDLKFIEDISLADVYDYLFYLSRIKLNKQSKERGINAAARARMVSSLRSFYKYLNNKTNQIKNNPVKDLDSPKLRSSLPRYLSLDESRMLLDTLSENNGPNAVRDYCIVTLFLNCGMRVSELVGINLSDIKEDTLRVVGKGNKERILYLNDACLNAINEYMKVRPADGLSDRNALFISRERNRICVKTVQWLIKKYITQAGLDPSKYSAHKLRHTAATLMYRYGQVDVRALQEILGHKNLDTTKIYTHVDSERLREAANKNPLSKNIKAPKQNSSEKMREK